MITISVDVLNPRSLALLEELAKLQLIAIHKEEKGNRTVSKNNDFMTVVHKIRAKAQNPPTLNEITAEVEQQRAEMYADSM